MGCNIYGIFQRHDRLTGKWVDVPTEYDRTRHYLLFAVLADVRNSREVTPIARPRGLPDGFEVDAYDYHHVAMLEAVAPSDRDYFLEGGEGPPRVWLGDHSQSWLEGEEMWNWWATCPHEFFELAYFFNEVRRLMAEHGRIRFVFGFDS